VWANFFESISAETKGFCKQIIESLTSKIIEPLTEKTWAQGCVIQQREKWPRAEVTSLSRENILNE